MNGGMGISELLLVAVVLALGLIPLGLGVLILLALRGVRAEHAALLRTLQAIQLDLRQRPRAQ
jgi:hypothetical protein